MKKIKLFFEEHKIGIVIEAITVFIMIAAGVCMYRMALNQQKVETMLAMDEVISWETYYEGIYKGDGSTADIAGYFSDWLNGKLSYGKNAYYGLALELYDSEGNVLYRTTPRNLAVKWDPDSNKKKKEMIQLENYFEEKEINNFLEFYFTKREDETERNGLYVKKMAGYYDETSKYIPVQIWFADVNDNNKEFKLVNSKTVKESADKKVVYRLNSAVDNKKEKKNEKGSFGVNVQNNKKDLSDKAWEYLQEERKDGKSIVNSTDGGFFQSSDNACVNCSTYDGEEVKGYAAAMYVDNGYLALHSYIFKTSILLMFAFCQPMALELIRTYGRFQRKRKKLDETRNTFINAMAHEMKTPTAVIKNSVECIQEGIHPEKQGHYLDIIDQESEHMSKLLNHMLVYTRVSHAVYQPQKEKISLAELAEQVCGHYASIMERKQIRLQWDKTSSCMAEVDKQLMEMVLDNYISNAVKFCKQAGIIRITVSDKKICVYNEGNEITKEQAEHIWEPLYMGDESRAYETGSSGMGLAISASILKLHHMEYGMRNVESGVEFYFRV